MKLNFEPVNFDTISRYLELWKTTPQKSSDYSSGVLLCWEKALGYQFAFDETEPLVWIKGQYPNEHFLAPSGDWNACRDWEKIIGTRFGGRAEFQLTPETLAEIWKAEMGGAVEISENRASWEYLHAAKDLAELSGNKYMRKRNRVNQFRKQNPYSYVPLTARELPRIAEFQREWCESYREFGSYDSISAENEGIIRNILGNWDKLPQLLGGMIETMGQIAAYTIAETAGDGMIMIHFEKASLNYNAAYQVINREFLLHEGAPFETVNREEDMDDPGLREAKMSYHPSGFIKKYTVAIEL
ncbi:MAG: phosphatidylglycerol lysyltransferase domain-containing protein [Synergistaceae bacterium]|nr:phosphatidylglycerol lysyltransferase domain-containing protein [Synergistaceae bacterium]